MSKESSSSGGIGFAGLLTIAFIVLKLTGYIDWSWWWVLSPTLFSVGCWLVVIAIVGMVAIVGRARSKKKIDALINDLPAPRKSKFEQKLEEAMAASEAKRKAKLN